jgi:predicted dehydrogenase
MKQQIRIALLGINGYGNTYLNELLDNADGKDVKIEAAIDPAADKCLRLQELKDLQVPIYHSLDDFYQKQTADLVIMSTPIQLHAPQTCQALAQGSSVLCEKPAAATIQETIAMQKAEAESEGFIAIGYQWSFSQAVQDLKQAVINGEFGKPLRFKTLVFWLRNYAYYHRNNWAGKQKNANGEWILDSPANNATAHYLHNMLYTLGKTRESSAVLDNVQAELYRANDITNFDTAAIRCYTDEGTEILFYTSHAVPSSLGPVFIYEFENATVTYDDPNTEFVARFKDGSIKNYGNPNINSQKKLWDCVNAIRNKEKVACGINAASVQTLCVNGAQDSMPEIIDFPKEFIQEMGEGENCVVWGQSITSMFTQCYAQNLLPSETKAWDWSKSGKIISLKDYRKFR